jgi:glycosyltransferase involved in cell wall biosynthesis
MRWDRAFAPRSLTPPARRGITGAVRISAAIITLDEEENLGRCLASLRDVADEIVVVDSGSTDGTERVARAAGAVFVPQRWLGYGPQKNQAVDRTSHEWVLSLDADEALSDALRASILALKAGGPRADAYEVSRLNWYCGRFLRHSGWYPDRKVRLWRKGSARWAEATIHELAEVAPGTRVERLPGDLLHYTIKDRAQHLRTIEKFTTLSAESLLREGRVGDAWKRFVSPPATFVKGYLLKAGFLDGRAGWDVCRLSAYASWLKYEKLRRLARKRA